MMINWAEAAQKTVKQLRRGRNDIIQELSQESFVESEDEQEQVNLRVVQALTIFAKDDLDNQRDRKTKRKLSRKKNVCKASCKACSLHEILQLAGSQRSA